jgi:exodeoxyribonuclease-3
VAVYSREEPIRVIEELPDETYAQEGRVLHLEYPLFHFLNIYFPNGQSSGERLDFKFGFYDAYFEYIQQLRKQKPVVTCGDFNIAHRAIDLAEPDRNEDVSGFLPEERAIMTRLISKGYLDTFRSLNGDVPDQYSWWPYWGGSKGLNNGWRIDYFLASDELEPKFSRAWIEPEVNFSDHCPIGLELDL